MLSFDDICKGAFKSMVGFCDDLETWLNQRGHCEAVMQKAESIQERDDAAIRALRVQKAKPAEVLIHRISLAVKAMRSGADTIARTGNEERILQLAKKDEEIEEAEMLNNKK